MNKRKILVTAALPYANGEIHLGHLLEYIQADIWVRYQKMCNHVCYFICADDAHGTPIMLKADEMGISPETLIAEVKERHQEDFSGFNIDFSYYHSTHSIENKAIVSEIYTQLNAKGYIKKRIISGAFDAKKQIFLPDRFIKGTCPECDRKNQYGDSCEACGATYTPMDLKNPKSVLSNTTPVKKESEHYFFDLPQFTQALKKWLAGERLQKEMYNKLSQWFESGLLAWDISRDAPYFGFKIPESEDKYFYVWLDAPIGYMASFKKFCSENNLNFDEFWQLNSKTELYHFIGKDIIYFHALFWPAILMAAHYRTPSAIFAHGFLTVNGSKMSKSRGTFITARTYLTHLNAEYLRYYYAYKLTPKIDDIDLNLTDFKTRVNADIIGKVVNIASRSAGFIVKKFAKTLSQRITEPKLYAHFINAENKISSSYENRDYAAAMRLIMALADKANQYIDDKKPWQLIKEENKADEVCDIASMGINLFRVLIIYLKPVLPDLAKRTEEFLNIKPLLWSDIQNPLVNHRINRFKPLLMRIEESDIAKIFTQEEQATNFKKMPEKYKKNNMITYDDIKKLDLRVAKIIKAQTVEGADKLLQLTLDTGEKIPKNVFSAIKSNYKPEALEGRLTVVVANLTPRKMRFGVSEAMILTAGDDKSLYLLSPDSGAFAGMKID